MDSNQKAAGVSKPHAAECPEGRCQTCGAISAACECGQTSDGPLKDLFSNCNRHHVGADLDEPDFCPTYPHGQLSSLRANKVTRAALRQIARNAPRLADISIPMPYLNSRSLDDVVATLLKWPARKKLRVLQLGETARRWNAG